jgi:hypothetical protein
MKIDYKKGKYGPNDRTIWIKTDNHSEEGEIVTIFRLGLLVNQLAINERSLRDPKFWSKCPFFFKEFIQQCIEDAIDGKDWAEPENEDYIEKICYKYGIKTENIDYDLLRKTQQRKLTEFKEVKKDEKTYE